MNVNWIASLPASLRRAAYFGLQRAIGSRIDATWREWRKWEQYKPEQLEAAVESRLSQLLTAAARDSAFYRKLNLKPRAHECATDFLRRFPILTREQIRSEFAEIVVDSLRGEITSPASVSKRRYDWMVVKTGGTTGNPTSVVHDARFRDWGRASRLFSQRLCEFPLGTRYFRLWGSEQELMQQEEKIDRRVLRNLLGEIPMNAFRAKESDLLRHLATIERNPEITHMMAYVDAAASFARFLESSNHPKPRFKTIMACAGTVTTEWRQILQRVFEAEVFDKYGSRECADIACECSQHAGLHIYSPVVYVEVVDGNGNDCPPGDPGRILVSLLNNLSFPMIRYQIGDMGALANPEPCHCGLAFPRLKSLQGREDEMLLTEDGTLLSSVFIRHFVGVSLNDQLIRQWQFEQTDPGAFTFRYVAMKTDGLEQNLNKLEASFKTALGANANIQMERVSEIKPSRSGKMVWVKNRCKV
ncbi:MAG: hypothetical protein O2960_11755 [Verrucomicrobia bacterium]|nr:hypothetical protein [Verrucomicrobiota bacterium]